VANYTKVFALRPNVLDASQELNVAIKVGMDLCRYEPATLAAARALKSSYCSLAHGKVLRDKFYAAEAVEAMTNSDHEAAGLDATDVAIMEFAGKVARNAPSITAEDVDLLRRHGLSDVDVFQVILAAARAYPTPKTLTSSCHGGFTAWRPGTAGPAGRGGSAGA
jgi:alkylhydroperoxidase family enzyme